MTDQELAAYVMTQQPQSVPGISAKDYINSFRGFGNTSGFQLAKGSVPLGSDGVVVGAGVNRYRSGNPALDSAFVQTPFMGGNLRFGYENGPAYLGKIGHKSMMGIPEERYSIGFTKRF